MKNLEPQIVWNFFHEITQIPRPSKKEDKIRAYLQEFGEKMNLPAKTDNAGNVLITKPATSGYEDKPTVILQSHMDMVCEKNNDVKHDFEKDAIETYIEDDWVKAKGTTLGADNGIGMAMMLAILASENLQHPALECLFTTDEETGLTGAFALEENFLTGKTLINLDSEDDGEIFVGCAGGIDTVADFKYKIKDTPKDYFAFSVSVTGLKGGHSGDDIDKHLANANKLLNRILWNMYNELDLLLVKIDGGNLRNAIPREASAVCCVPFEDKEQVRIIFNHIAGELEQEHAAVETKMRIELHSEDIPKHTMTKKSTEKILNAIYACPHGIKEMSADMPGLVETSTNLASVKMKGKDKVEIVTSQRSSVESAKYDIMYQVETVFRLMGAKVSHGDGYPGWKPNLNSEILKKAEESYQRLFDKKAKVRAIHAGLECGLFLEKYPDLDMISIGPDMRGVHSPDERLSISSTQNCWLWLTDVLGSL
ncbi:Cytosol non-specific dipeptidase [uncultured Paludibacter sp.]|uniref:Cytosol non-specific dipeptidase n=1 Tax=uncultured Paludibacter sp. TaxID=497635 RepID=A0A653A9W9_9BACT|nr:Cytosol non-specific dipeptidase [uncultured Paludibacter sp.]